MASRGLILERSSLVSIYFACTLYSLKKRSLLVTYCFTSVSCSPCLTFAACGCVRFLIIWVPCPSHRGLEAGEMVQPSAGPADSGGDAATSYQRANPTTPPTDRLLLWVISWVNRSPRLICLQQSGSPGGHPEGPSLKSGKSSIGGCLPEAGPWWWIQGHPSGRFLCIWCG